MSDLLWLSGVKLGQNLLWNIWLKLCNLLSVTWGLKLCLCSYLVYFYQSIVTYFFSLENLDCANRFLGMLFNLPMAELLSTWFLIARKLFQASISFWLWLKLLHLNLKTMTTVKYKYINQCVIYAYIYNDLCPCLHVLLLS